MRWVVIGLLTLASAGCGRPPAQLTSGDAQPAVDAIVERGRDELGLPGVSLAIMRGQELVIAKGYGLANHESGALASARTLYPIGSVSKQFTAAAVMKLVENGRLQLDAPTSKYLPAFAAGQTAVPTIRNLLQQNSGLPEWDVLPALEDPDAGDPGRFHLAKLVEIIARRPLLYRPGEWWSYSNSNYTVLAAVIEQATVAGYNEYLASTFFVRLGLRSTDVCGSVRLASRDRAIGYRDTQAYAPRPVTTTKANAYIGAASLCSNVVDLANWMRALVDGKAISAASFRQMTTATPVRAGFTPPYGFGVSLLPLVGQRAIWHGGALSGYMADLAYFPDHDLIISILGNARRVRLEQIVKDVARELLWVPTPQLLDLAIDSTLAKRVAGNYDDGMFTFRIFMAGPELFLDVPPAVNPTRLRYQGGREFVTARPTDFRLRFEPEAGQTQRVVWEWGELRAYGRRTR